jgi:hypothetical protein
VASICQTPHMSGATRRTLDQVPDALDPLAAGLEQVPLASREAAADVLSGYASFYRTEAAGLAGGTPPPAIAARRLAPA